MLRAGSARDELRTGDALYRLELHSSGIERDSVDSDGNQGNEDSSEPSILADGRFVAFESYATNLVVSDTTPITPDIFVHDRQTGETTLVSVDSDGNQGDNGSGYPSISADGRFVAIVSEAENLVVGDTNEDADIFVTGNPFLGVTKHYYANGQRACPERSRRVATRVDGTLYYVHQDHLGSTVAVSDEDGQAVGRVQYDPWGTVITSTLPMALTDRLFTGQRWHGTIGLYQMGARWYDPALGRWLQADSMVPEPGNPQALNRYAYVYNNPLRYTDPSGHQGEPKDCPPKLTPEQLEIVQRVAEEFRIPPELLAAVLNTERVYDTDWYDFIQNAYQITVLLYAHGAVKVPFGTRPLSASIQKIFGRTQMAAWEALWKPGARGVGPGIGLGHIHTGPAQEVERYFAERGLSHLLPAATSSTELWETLLSDGGNIRYAAASVRRLLEIRQGGEWEYGQITTIDSLSTNDAELIMDGYWAGVHTPYGDAGYTAREFRMATVPKNTMGPLIDCSYGYYQQYFAGGQ